MKIDDIMMILLANEVADTEIFYYNLGDECTALTGGWVAFSVRSTPVYTKNADNLQIECSESTDAVGFFYTNTAIDLTDIDTIEFDVVGVVPGSIDSVSVGISSSKTSQTFTYQVSFDASFSRQIVSLDVSAITGTWYVGIRASNSNQGATGLVSINAYSIYGK